MNFNIGDVVVIRKPDNTYEPPCWIEPAMDKYDGKITAIRGFERGYVRLEECGALWFSEDWLEPFTQEDEEIIMYDIFSIM